MDGHLPCRCLRIKAWGKAGQAEFGTQAPSAGDAELPSMVRPWYSRNKRERSSRQRLHLQQTSLKMERSREQLATSGKAALLLPAWTAAIMATSSPPVWVLPGSGAAAQFSSEDEHMGREWGGKQGHSVLTASPTLALLCACLVRGQGQGFQWRGR